MNPRINRPAQAAAAFVFASALALTAHAQSRGGAARGGTSPSPTAADTARSEMEREMMERQLEEVGAPKRKEREDSALLFAQVSEDFTRIQVVNNDLVRAASRAEALDLQFVAKSAAEVKKLAQRLKTNMALPPPDKPAELPRLDGGAGADDVRPSLLTLGKLIAGFAHNPIFKEPNVIDARLSSKARCDLEAIIELSGQLAKVCEKLSKADAKSK